MKNRSRTPLIALVALAALSLACGTVTVDAGVTPFPSQPTAVPVQPTQPPTPQPEATTAVIPEVNTVPTSPAGDYTEYMWVTDDYSVLEMQVPVQWAEVDGSAWIWENVQIGASIWAAPNLVDFRDTWTTPGVKFEASDDLATLGGYVQLLDFVRPDYADCKLENRYDYNDGVYRGKYDWYNFCGGSGSSAIVLSAVPIDNPGAFLILLQGQMATQADVTAMDQVLATFQVVGALP